MLVRHADAAADAAACARIYVPFVRDTAVSLEEEPPGTAELERRIEQTSARYPWLVAEHEGYLAGFAYASAHRQRASYRWASDVSVYVDPAHQRRGVASSLYRELFAALRRQKLLIACAGITLPNEGSVALHESLGFGLVGIYRRSGYKRGAWRDVGWWQLALAPQEGEPPEPHTAAGPDGVAGSA